MGKGLLLALNGHPSRAQRCPLFEGKADIEQWLDLRDYAPASFVLKCQLAGSPISGTLGPLSFCVVMFSS